MQLNNEATPNIERLLEVIHSGALSGCEWLRCHVMDAEGRLSVRALRRLGRVARPSGFEGLTSSFGPPWRLCAGLKTIRNQWKALKSDGHMVFAMFSAPWLFSEASEERG